MKEDGATSAGVAVAAVASKTKIPLIQRGGPVGPQAAEEGKAKKGKGQPNAGPGNESPSGEDGLEEKTIVDAYTFATG